VTVVLHLYCSTDIACIPLALPTPVRLAEVHNAVFECSSQFLEVDVPQRQGSAYWWYLTTSMSPISLISPRARLQLGPGICCHDSNSHGCLNSLLKGSPWFKEVVIVGKTSYPQMQAGDGRHGVRIINHVQGCQSTTERCDSQRCHESQRGVSTDSSPFATVSYCLSCSGCRTGWGGAELKLNRKKTFLTHRKDVVS
jgi:hypothetical protein